jgi:hypothetical protein
MSMPWAKFFWTDYAADPELKLCSFAAQGLWMRMLCIAAEHEPAGYVAINGRGLDPTGICRITGGALDEVTALLEELRQNGVYSTDRRGWIYSRRMIKDAKMRRKASEAGKKGGNPKLCKDTENPAPLKGEDKGTLKGDPKPQKPEARSSVDKSTDGKPSDLDEDPVKKLFDLGVHLLTSTGSTEKQARSLVGKWRKETKDDGKVLKAILDCKAAAVAEPIEWLTKRFKSAAYVSASGYQYRGDLDAIIRESEKRADWDTHWAAKSERKRMKEAN